LNEAGERIAEKKRLFPNRTSSSIQSTRCDGGIIGKSPRRFRRLRRTSGWFAQVVVDDGLQAPLKVKVESAVGIDVGLESFATLSNGS
jgi:hypothetical protein